MLIHYHPAYYNVQVVAYNYQSKYPSSRKKTFIIRYNRLSCLVSSEKIRKVKKYKKRSHLHSICFRVQKPHACLTLYKILIAKCQTSSFFLLTSHGDYNGIVINSIA